jgi:hypothetical protein
LAGSVDAEKVRSAESISDQVSDLSRIFPLFERLFPVAVNTALEEIGASLTQATLRVIVAILDVYTPSDTSKVKKSVPKKLGFGI